MQNEKIPPKFSIFVNQLKTLFPLPAAKSPTLYHVHFPAIFSPSSYLSVHVEFFILQNITQSQICWIHSNLFPEPNCLFFLLNYTQRPKTTHLKSKKILSFLKLAWNKTKKKTWNNRIFSPFGGFWPSGPLIHLLFFSFSIYKIRS